MDTATGGRAHAFAFLIEMEDQTNLVTDRRTGMIVTSQHVTQSRSFL